MVKVGGNEKHKKYVKKHVHFRKSGREICNSKGGIIIFLK